MTRNEENGLLGLPDGEDAATIRRAFEQRSAELNGRIASAPTASLRVTYRRQAERLRQARDLLLDGNHPRNDPDPLSLTKQHDLPARGMAATGWSDSDERAGVATLGLAPGQMLAERDEVRSHLGSGGTGAVFAAFDRVKRHQPHMAIAYGAALIAAQRSGSPSGKAPPLLQRVSGFDLGCRVFDPATSQPAVDAVIARNTPIPARRTITYYTNRADQARIILDVVQVKAPGEPPASLGYFAFPVDRPRKNQPWKSRSATTSMGWSASWRATPTPAARSSATSPARTARRIASWPRRRCWRA
jgi:hypothetical protein